MKLRFVHKTFDLFVSVNEARCFLTFSEALQIPTLSLDQIVLLDQSTSKDTLTASLWFWSMLPNYSRLSGPSILRCPWARYC